MNLRVSFTFHSQLLTLIPRMRHAATSVGTSQTALPRDKLPVTLAKLLTLGCLSEVQSGRKLVQDSLLGSPSNNLGSSAWNLLSSAPGNV